MTSTGKPAFTERKPRSIARAAVLLAGLLLAIMLAAYAVRSFLAPDQAAVESLAEFVLANGKTGRAVPEGITYFGIPPGDLRFHQTTAVSESGRSKSIQVRRRQDSGYIDIFLLDVLPNETAGYFYLTSTHGRLIKAAYFDPVAKPVEDAAERFEQEKEFWQLWLREKVKAASN